MGHLPHNQDGGINRNLSSAYRNPGPKNIESLVESTAI